MKGKVNLLGAFLQMTKWTPKHSFPRFPAPVLGTEPRNSQMQGYTFSPSHIRFCCCCCFVFWVNHLALLRLCAQESLMMVFRRLYGMQEPGIQSRPALCKANPTPMYYYTDSVLLQAITRLLLSYIFLPKTLQKQTSVPNSEHWPADHMIDRERNLRCIFLQAALPLA